MHRHLTNIIPFNHCDKPISPDLDPHFTNGVRAQPLELDCLD